MRNLSFFKKGPLTPLNSLHIINSFENMKKAMDYFTSKKYIFCHTEFCVQLQGFIFTP